MSAAPFDNLRGGGWLIADMALNIWALSIVKALGLGYGASQIVFLRALTGLVLIAPLIWRHRARFRAVPQMRLHLLRVGLSAVALNASFFAIARIPLALFTAIGFTRPLVTMLLAAALLGEVIGRRRWVAAGIAFAGVLIAANPQTVPWSWGLAAQALVVVAGSGAIIATRALRGTPEIVLMAIYTVGLAVISAPLAWWGWAPVAPAHLPWLVMVGLFAQTAQFCFLRAHFLGQAGFLSVLGYLSLILSVGVGYLVFDEIPTATFALGAALVTGAALWATLDLRQRRRA